MKTLGFTLSDGQSCKAGRFACNYRHTFYPDKKITRVECIIFRSENFLEQIHFLHNEERLVWVGDKLDYSRYFVGTTRVEVFDIADDEQLIGFELDETNV